MKVLQNLDLSGNELKNVVVDNESASPVSPVAGQMYYDTADSKLKYYDGSTWVEAGGSGGSSLPTTTSILKGDGNGGAAAAVSGTDYQAPLTFATSPTSSNKVVTEADLTAAIGASIAASY